MSFIRDPGGSSGFRRRLTRPLRTDVIIEQCRKYIYKDPKTEVRLYNDYIDLWRQKRQSYSLIEPNVISIDNQIKSTLKINDNFGLLYTGVIHEVNENGSLESIIYQLDILDASALDCPDVFELFVRDTIEYIDKICEFRTLLGQDDSFIYMDRDVFLQSRILSEGSCLKMFDNARSYCQDELHSGRVLRFSCVEGRLKEEISNEFKRYAVSAITTNSKQLPLYILIQEIITIMNM